MNEPEAFAAIRESTTGVISTMLSLEACPGEASQQHDPPPLNGVMALLSFTGDWVGSGVLYCHEKLACRLSSAMLLSEVTEVNNDVLDGIGELGNMVLGNVKDRLESMVGALAMSVPTVVYGRNFQTRTNLHRNWLIVPFQIGDDTLEVRLCLSPKIKPA